MGHLVRAGVAALALLAFAAHGQTNLAIVAPTSPPVGLPFPQVVARPTGAVTLTWSNSPDRSVTGYYVNFWWQSATGFVRVDAGLTNRFTLTNLWVGTNYSVAVSAHTAFGEVSPRSNQIDFTCPQSLPPMLTIRPYSYAIETYGYPGVANRLEATTNLQNWVTAALFNGKTGMLFLYVEVPTNQQRYFRVIKL